MTATTSKIIKSISVDWGEIDDLIARDKMPEGAVTRAMIQTRYNVSETSAMRRLNKLIESGWDSGKIMHNGSMTKYAIKKH